MPFQQDDDVALRTAREHWNPPKPLEIVTTGICYGNLPELIDRGDGTFAPVDRATVMCAEPELRDSSLSCDSARPRT